MRRVYESVQAMVADNRGAEVVYDIAVPAKAILGILQQLPEGSHALIQKPMGENLQEARAIRDLCRSKKIHGAVNFQLRTAAYIIALKHLLSEGVIGEVTGIEFRVNVETPWWKWPFLEQASRMEIIYHSIHYIDCLRDLYGEPQRLHAMTYKHVSTPRLHSVRSDLLFLYSPWVQATIHTNHFHRWGTQHAESALQVEGTKGAVVIRMGGNIAYPRSDLDFLHVATDATSGDWLDVKLQGSWFPPRLQGHHGQRDAQGPGRDRRGAHQRGRRLPHHGRVRGGLRQRGAAHAHQVRLRRPFAVSAQLTQRPSGSRAGRARAAQQQQVESVLCLCCPGAGSSPQALRMHCSQLRLSHSQHSALRPRATAAVSHGQRGSASILHQSDSQPCSLQSVSRSAAHRR